MKRRFPRVTVLIGGAMDLDGRGWYRRALSSIRGGRAFDVANVHVRGRKATVASTVRRWRRLFRRHGHGGPLWVTEAGYPSDPRFQNDPAYRNGEPGQARYLRDALPAMVRAGADQVFVTLRDSWSSEFGPETPFGSEGVLAMEEHEPYSVRRKRAFGVVRGLARRRRNDRVTPRLSVAGDFR